ncbi:MAG: AsmA family protein, partial [Hyphomicrobiales bacterium]
MSVWKSPVLYFGIALLFVVSALVAAPYVLDWNAYKPGLESYGKRLTGRDVHIGGDVEIRLFPWPRLTAENVSIASPEGFGDSGFVDTDVLTLSLQLGSLLNGQLNVESVELLEPRITLARNSKGEVNWLLHPDQDLRRSSLLANVRLDQIQLLNATIRYDDQLKGLATAITTFDADMSAAAIEGPWKVKGSGSWNDMPLGITLTTSPYKDGEPLRFGVRFTPGDSAYPTFTVDGGYRDGTFEGTTSAGPQEDEG